MNIISYLLGEVKAKYFVGDLRPWQPKVKNRESEKEHERFVRDPFADP